MGDHYQSLVPKNVSSNDVAAFAERGTQFLIAREIVLPDSTDCILGDGGGYPPGPASDSVVQEPQRYSHYKTLKTNGVQVIAKRTFFYGWTDFPIQCPKCGADHKSHHYVWGDAVDQWYHGDDGALLRCTACGNATRVTEWEYRGQVAFGDLGFTFWNWPVLREDFVAEFSLMMQRCVASLCGKI